MSPCPDCECEFLADADIIAEWRYLAAEVGQDAADLFKMWVLEEYHESEHRWHWPGDGDG